MLEKEQALTKLKELVNQFSSANMNKEYVNAQNEEWVKWNYIEPLLEILGWKRTDIEKEYRVLKGRADYLLKIGNEEALVVEAKKVSVPLSEEEGRQAVSYAYHRKIKFAVLTNFKEVRVYHALTNIRNIDKNLLRFETGGYFRFTFDQFIDNFDKLSFLSRESIEKKEMDKLLSKKEEKTAKSIDESILDDLLEIREWLSKDLKKLRAHLTKEQIDEIVQIFIDRLIFMRSVEDRGLEERDFLLKMVKDFQEGRTDKRLWESLKIKFKIFDKEYNSKLFAEGILEKEGFFDEQTLGKVIKELYFGNEGQQERYMFDEIPGDLLGTIYEQYLGTILQGTEKRVTLDASSGKRKKMGIYYTPAYIVDYIVKNTVYEYIKDKTIDEILEINIVDPACGSGSFLIKAFECVCKVIEEKLKKGERGKALSFHEYKYRLSLGQKALILTSCIYGVDLDEKAIELAQLNLLLKLLEEETAETRKRILPNMRDNIKCGNSLIDDPAVAGDKAFKWEAQFPEAFSKGGFDIVIGNPPYVRQEELSSIKKYLSEHYKVYESTADLFIYFFEKELNIIKKEGLFGMIVSNKWLKAGYGQKLRTFLKDYSLESFLDFGDLQIFEGATTYPCILKIRKNNQRKKSIEFCQIKTLSFPSLEAYFQKNKSLIYQENLEDEGWNLKGKDISFILDKIHRVSVPLKEYIHGETYRGILTGLSEAFVITQTTRDELIKSNKNSIDIIKPFLTGSEVRRYNIEFEKKYIILTKIGVDLKNYPAILKWLTKFKNALEKRWDKGEYWYELRSCNYYGLFEKPKLVYGVMTTQPRFTIDTEGYFVNNANFFIPTEDKKLLGILNSKLGWFLISNSCTQIRGGYQLIWKYFGNVSISKENSSILESLVNNMLVLQNKFHDSKGSGNEKERLEQQIKNIDYEIDQEVYKLYGITKEEQQTIEESLK